MINRLIPRVGARIAVIGAGPAGLAATREFVQAGYETHTYEATSNIGGNWVYSPTPSPTTALYKSLSCNIPVETMAFADFPFPPGTSSYTSHTSVLSYLQSYAREHELERHIRFDSPVADLRKAPGGDGLWRVRTAAGATESYHAVLVCTGHYSKPRGWEPPGVEHLAQNGVDVMHSCNYREAAPYAGRDVLVIGSGPSGIDISMELSTVARSVVLTHTRGRTIFPKRPPQNLREVHTRPARVLPSGEVEMDNGAVMRFDKVLLCTGYLFSVPFVHAPGPPPVQVAPHEQSIRGLAALCVSVGDPTLSLIGLPIHIVPFPLFEDQIAFFRAVVEGRVTRGDLEKWVREEETMIREERGGDDRKVAWLGEKQWEYRRRLACAAGRQVVAPSVVEIYNDSAEHRKIDPVRFRKVQYHILGRGPGEWRVTLDGEDITGLREMVGDIFADGQRL